MIELAQHIENLLLENDCVIVPNFGGFVAHYTSAIRVKDENLFYPPCRTIGFNPQLKINDGVLVQSYMSVLDTNFSDATKRVDKDVKELIAKLHEDGKVELENIGEIRYTIYDTYEFVSFDNKITTPYLYGLDSFEMKELSSLQQAEKMTAPQHTLPSEKKTYEIRINRAFIRNSVAAIAAVILFFSFSVPVENTYIEKNNYAQLLPNELFEQIENRSIAMTPVEVSSQRNLQQNKTSKKLSANQAQVSRPIAVREVKVAPKNISAQPKQDIKTTEDKSSVVTSNSNTGKFHIIVASSISLKDAEAMTKDLKNKGYSNAKTLAKNGMIRVAILSCETRDEATKQLLKLRENKKYESAWTLAE